MCACPKIKKTHDKKCSIKNHNLFEENTIIHNFNINSMVEFHSCVVFDT